MKIYPLLAAILFAAGFAGAAEQISGIPASTNVRYADYPRILPGNCIVFRAKAPEAKSVKFITYKAYDAVCDKDGFWTATTDEQSAGFHYYWMEIDGVRVCDPSSETFYGCGAQTSGIEIPEAPGVGDYYLQQDVPHGEVRERWYHSKVTDSWRRIFVYTPAGYDKDTADRYPVLYLIHGGGEDERAWVNQGHVSQIMDNLVAAGKAKPMLVVMEQGYATPAGQQDVPLAPPAGLFDSKPSAAKQQMPSLPPNILNNINAVDAVFMQDLIPLVDSTYRTIPDKGSRAVAGFSMGGMEAFQLGLEHLDTFSAIGGLSGAGGGFGDGSFDAKTYFGGVFADADAFNAKGELIFIGLGTVEPPRIHDGVSGYHNALTEAGIKHVFFTSEGTSHEWLTERRSLREFVSLLFR